MAFSSSLSKSPTDPYAFFKMSFYWSYIVIWLLHSVVVVSTVEQNESVIYISPLFKFSFLFSHYRALSRVLVPYRFSLLVIYFIYSINSVGLPWQLSW